MASSRWAGLVFDRDMLVAKLSPHGDDLSELFCGGIALHDPCWHDRNVFRDQPRIEAVVLGEHATGAAELAQLVRVDASHRQVRRQQGSDDGAPRWAFTCISSFWRLGRLRGSRKFKISKTDQQADRNAGVHRVTQ